MQPHSRSLVLARDGAEHIPGAARAVLDTLAAITASLPPDRAGVRLYGIDGLAALAGVHGAIGRIAAGRLGRQARPVRAILFDKSPATNWALGWHQDRTIIVRERRDVPGFGPWTRKRGMLHVAPPFDLLAAMLTMRVHLDAVPHDNAPLRIAPGSHWQQFAEADIEAAVATHGVVDCLAEAGDVWLYATPILHASAAATRARRRRVLQIDYAASDCPAAWPGSGSNR